MDLMDVEAHLKNKKKIQEDNEEQQNDYNQNKGGFDGIGNGSQEEEERLANEEVARLEEEARLAEEEVARCLEEEARLAEEEAARCEEEARLAEEEERLANEEVARLEEESRLADEEVARCEEEERLANEEEVARCEEEERLANEEVARCEEEARLAEEEVARLALEDEEEVEEYSEESDQDDYEQEDDIDFESLDEEEENPEKRKKKTKEEIGGENINNLYMKLKFKKFTDDFEEIKIKVKCKGTESEKGDDCTAGFDVSIRSNCDDECLAWRYGVITAKKENHYKSHKFVLKRDDEKFGEFMNNDNNLQLVIRTEGEGSEIHAKKGVIKLK